MEIQKLENISNKILRGVNDLMPQLSSTAKLLNVESLQKIVDSESSHLLVATENEKIIGMITLVVFDIPTGTRSWIEDVVVSEQARGKGIGGQLLQAAIVLAKEKGARTIDMTSRPSREAANRLYEKSGFKKRETNVYRYSR